jgi:hypothetical protein
MDICKEFTKKLDVLAKAEWKKIYTCIKPFNTIITSITFELIVDDNILAKYWLNKNIKFFLEVDSDGSKMAYYYNNMPINPECYYLRPDPYYDVSMLEILWQSIIQDTYEPDIKFLERGEICLKTNRRLKLRKILS